MNLEVVDRVIADFLVGNSPGIRRVRALIARLAPSTLPIHIHGPTGSGKELVARALHAASRRSGRMVSLNVCAIADGVFESTLFGHTRGAFTGASSDQEGMLLEANNGTVFLDEIGSLGSGAQAKLLRAIELREFRPVGAKRDRSSHFRLLSATNDDLDAFVARGTFRDDLLHRLRGAVITVPPLVERREDIPLLARHFAARFSDGPIDETAIGELQQRPWPGNVRELSLVVQCAAALAGSSRITRSVVLEALDLRRAPTAQERGRDDFEARKLLELLEGNGWDVDVAAGIMGVHRTTVYRRLRKLGLASGPDQAIA